METQQVTDLETLRSWYAIAHRSQVHDRPETPGWTWDETASVYSTPSSSEQREWWLGRDATGEAVMSYMLEMRLLDNLDVAFLELSVHPEHRRRGYGQSALDHALARVRALGRTRVVAEIAEPLNRPSPGVLFAESVGATKALAELHRVLRLDELDDAGVAALEAEARGASDGYELMSWSGNCPSQWIEQYAVLVSRMSTDAPLDDLAYEAEVWTPQQICEREELLTGQGRSHHVVAAVHVATGSLVAFTDVVYNEEQPEHVFQWDTLVLREHRGHRLGLLVKLANLDWIRANWPKARLIHTWNADSNAHMVSINERMGFVPLERSAEWELCL